MYGISSLSLKAKTIVMAMTCSVIALMIAIAFNAFYQNKVSEEQTKEEINVIAKILADRSTAALQFGDSNLAAQNLEALDARNSIDTGCLYDENSKLFAEFHRKLETLVECPSESPKLGVFIEADRLLLTRPIVLDGVPIGAIYIETSLYKLEELLFLNLGVSIIIGAIAAITALLLAARLQNVVTEPIKLLEKTASSVQATNNYSLRASKQTNDEIGRLVDSFNNMLNRIETDTSALRDSEERFRTLTTASPVGVFQTNETGEYNYVNDRWREITGIYDLQMNQETFIKSLHPEERFQVLAQWKDSIESGEEFKMEYRLLKNSGEEVNVICQAKPMIATDGSIKGYLGSVADITELKSVQFQLEQLALYDSLTKLANRHLFRNRLEKAIRNAKRTHKKLAVLFLDIDHFKRINDTLGHDQGDELLRSIAHRLRFCTRPGDTVARLGGDEFTVLVPEFDNSYEADSIARKILEVLKVPIRLRGQEVIITTSIGITVGLEDADDANVLMKNADLAMYKAKSQGRDNYQFFSEEMNVEISRQLEIESELRRALQNEEFELYFQPQVATPEMTIIGYEALLRWKHPTRGLVPPGEFIPIAEDSGLIVPIGEWVIRNACEQVKRFRTHGILPANGHIAVNLSARQFHDPNLVNLIRDLIVTTGINPQQIELEITESLLMENIDNTIQTLNELKALGMNLSIDDFGTGYSSLNYLKRLPIQILKVDRSFVMDIPQDKDDMEITAAVIAMAHKLGLKVVAEGVEEQAQVDFLLENKCDFVQGYFFGKPMPVSELLGAGKKNTALKS